MSQSEDTTLAIKKLKRKWISAAQEVKHINDQGRAALTDSSAVNTFKGAFRSLEKYYDKFDNYWEELVDLGVGGEFPSESDKQTKSGIRNYYYEALAAYEQLSVPTVQPTNTTLPNTTLNETRCNSNLPKLELPTFDGSISNWPKFRDLFSAIIDKDLSLNNTQKFHYLISSLSGPALAVVKELTLVEANYELAWQSLLDTFDKKRLLANTYLNQIINFKPLTGKVGIEGLKLFLSKVSENISAFALLNIENEAEFILFSLAMRALDPDTRRLFEVTHKNVEFPSYKLLTTFIKEQCLALQLATSEGFSNSPSVDHYSNNKPSFSRFNKSRQKSSTSLFLNNKTKPESTPSCLVCNMGSHGLLSCKMFYSANVEDRLRWLEGWSGCRNCLSSSHKTANCKSKWTCRLCKGRHHSMLHRIPSHKVPSAPPPQSTEQLKDLPVQSSDNIVTNSATINLGQIHQVFLGTIIADIQDHNGQYHSFRCVLDSGSQQSFISTRCLKILGLPMQKCRKKISTIGQTLFEHSKGQISCTLRPKNSTNNIHLCTTAIVVKEITSFLPQTALPLWLREKYSAYNLADPGFWEPGPIDFLLGAEIFPEIWSGGPAINIGNNFPKLISSIFGHVVMGKLDLSQTDNSFLHVSLHTHSLEDLDTSLSRFWELEEPKISMTPHHDPEDELCEQHFLQTHYRLANGRYGVRLPFKCPEIQLGDSSTMALRRLHNLEIKLDKNPDLKTQYHNFMLEYRNLNHMSLTSASSKFIIPHHCVTKEDRNVTKLRVVFDGSARGSLGSLNDQLLVGPKLQRDIRDILLNFRSYPVVLIADIVKMYRQIELHPDDRVYQHIFWRFNQLEDINKYELNTLTYGLTSAPYLALRVLEQLRKDEGDAYPHAAQVLSRDNFVDDIISGGNSIEEVLALKEELIQLLKKGQFELSKWASNSNVIIGDHHSSNSVSLVEKSDSSLKILGLQWNSDSDTFSFNIQLPKPVFTKRAILSSVSRIYDPLGFLSPTVILMKSLIQLLWKAKLGWDDPIPQHITQVWSNILRNLHHLSKIKIPRYVLTPSLHTFQVIGFCDASNVGFSASIYLRLESESGVQVHFLTGKSKLAPVKPLTIPRLELNGALLLARLYNSIGEFIQLPSCPSKTPVFFTDAAVVLGWLNTPPHKLKTYVANRVVEITNSLPAATWKHVPTSHNPSDCASRGLSPELLPDFKLWWQGPDWLKENEIHWPSSTTYSDTNLPELKPEENLALTLTMDCSDLINWMSNFSTHLKLVRSIAWILRFKSNACITGDDAASKRNFSPLSLSEINIAQETCEKIIQLHYLFNGNFLKTEPVFEKFSKLHPFIDQHGILRVGGRLRHSNLSHDSKHPILLPRCHYTSILVDYYHKLFLHPGPTVLQAIIQTKYWICDLRRLVQHRTFLCITCYKYKAQCPQPIMGDLPSYRVQESRAFLHVGTDLAGPFLIRDSNRRKAAVSKAYLCLFICMTTKALHLEVVTAASTEAFIAALERFVARRGIPSVIYSDCGTNYVGAANQLRDFYHWFEEEINQQAIQDYCSKYKVKWKFNVPHSPHFVGIWEAGVKSAKTLLRKTAGHTPLTYEELSTLFVRIEAVLNSRPICPLSSNPEENDYLSPGHFLVGGPLLAIPRPTLLDTKENTLSRWQLVTKMSQHIWQRWRHEYLTTLQNRIKWTKSSKMKIEEGNLVLMKDSNTPFLQWPLARVVKVHPGKDGVVRVVTLKSKSSVFQRPVVKLIPLLPLNVHPYGENLTS